MTSAAAVLLIAGAIAAVFALMALLAALLEWARIDLPRMFGNVPEDDEP